jgi:GNAT superfamily N-acetyltransferase
VWLPNVVEIAWPTSRPGRRDELDFDGHLDCGVVDGVGSAQLDRGAGGHRRELLLATYDAQMREGVSMPLPDGVHEEQDGPVYRSWGWGPRGFVIHRDLSHLDRPAVDALIERQRRFFTDRQLAFEWKTYAHDRTADLSGRLRAAGFIPQAREGLVIGVVAELATEPRLPQGITLREVRSRADTGRMAEMMGAVWGEELGFLGELFSRDIDANPDDVVLLVAEVEGQIVSTARANLFRGSQFATLWAGSTLPQWRRRGIYRATVAYRARLAAQRGFKYLQVDASDQSRPILERLGFLTVSSTTPYVWSPPADRSPANRGGEGD